MLQHKACLRKVPVEGIHVVSIGMEADHSEGVGSEMVVDPTEYPLLGPLRDEGHDVAGDDRGVEGLVLTQC